MHKLTAIACALVALLASAALPSYASGRGEHMAGAWPPAEHPGAASALEHTTRLNYGVELGYSQVPTSTAVLAPGGAAPIGRSMAGPLVGLVLVFLASSAALGFAFGLRRRIDALAGPNPDEEED